MWKGPDDLLFPITSVVSSKKTSPCGFMLLSNTNFSYHKCASPFLTFYLNERELVYATANCQHGIYCTVKGDKWIPKHFVNEQLLLASIF